MRLWFRVIEVSEKMHWQQGQPNVFTVKLRPLQSESNRRWLAAIPDKPVEIQVLTAEGAQRFKAGAEVPVDFPWPPAPLSSAAVESAGSPATGARPAPSDPDEIC